jgi:prophage regulatory protein
VLLGFLYHYGESMKQNIIKINKVRELTTFSNSTIYRLVAKGEFPSQIKLAERSSGWIEQEVLGYLDNRIQKSRGNLC